MLATFGSDPEFFIQSRKDGKIKSAIGIVPGTKEDKIDLGNGHYAFYDNTMVEVNIRAESKRDKVISSFRECFNGLQKVIGKNNRLLVQASYVFSKKDMTHPDSFLFGCSEEFTIYNLNPNGHPAMVEPPLPDPKNLRRTAGGHIHIGHDCCNVNKGAYPPPFIWLCDLFIGIPSLLIDHDPTSQNRRAMYGGASYHRIKEYGIEYRTPSNFWLASPKLVGLIYDIVQFIVNNIDHLIETGDTIDKQLVCNTINKGDLKTAEKLWTKLGDAIPKTLLEQIREFQTPKTYDFDQEWGISVS